MPDCPGLWLGHTSPPLNSQLTESYIVSDKESKNRGGEDKTPSLFMSGISLLFKGGVSHLSAYIHHGDGGVTEKIHIV